MLWRRPLEPFAKPLFRLHAQARRSLTLGVRGLVQDVEGHVLLIEHTYTPGWHMPGGGVERGETAETALGRELMEEAGVALASPPALVSVHYSGARFKGDHVLLYRVRDYTLAEPTQRGEIHARGWFAPDALPEATTPSTRRRLDEVLAGAATDGRW